MQYLLPILELISVGAKVLNKERSLYYIKQAKGLEDKIKQVVDSDFYSKDMEAKGKAERELESKVQKLRLNFVSEGKQV